MTREFWTAERTAMLREMWEAGEVATTISKKIGCSRNAVIGKAHRLDLQARRGK